MVFSFDSTIRYSEVDSKCVLTLEALTNYFQDCSVFQSEALNIGMDHLKHENMAWVLASWQICIDRLPRLDEKVTISTWAYDMKAFYGYRNFSMTDEKGKTLAYANSIWVYMDAKNARPVKVPEKMAEIYGLEPKLEMNKAERKIHVPDDIEEAGSIVVPRFFIDSNQHMNNEKYILIAKQLLPEELAVKEIRVEYRKEAKLGDEIFSYISRENERYTVLLADKDKKPYAVLAFLI